MKNSKHYAEGIQKLYRSLKRKRSKAKLTDYEDLTESLVHGVILEHFTESGTRSALRRFNEYFVDYNDMRVSRPEEIMEMLADESETARSVAVNTVKVLASIFRKYNTVNLESLKKAGKRQARAVLEKFDGTSAFSVDYCTLTALQGHAIPLTGRMIEYLRENELVHPDADQQEIEGFLCRQIPAAKAYEFYSLLRHESETRRRAGTRKATTNRKIATKKKK